jgi:hypothetical protein
MQIVLILQDFNQSKQQIEVKVVNLSHQNQKRKIMRRKAF